MKQDSPEQPPGLEVHPVKPPDVIKQFFEHSAGILKALGYKTETVNWVYQSVQGNSYLDSINKELPVYVQVEAGRSRDGSCHKRLQNKCLAIVDVTNPSPKYALITRATPIINAQALFFQLGNPAIGKYGLSFPTFQRWLTSLSINTTVYFSNRQAKRERNTENARKLATQMVAAFFKNEEIQKGLGFSGIPDIVHMDVYPSNGERSKVHFEFAGGRCSLQLHCYANIQFNHGAKPQPAYEGAAFMYDYQKAGADESHPFVTFKEQIESA